MFPDKAITGSSLEALLAGSNPKITPDTKATISETNDAQSGGKKLKVGKASFRSCVVVCPKINPRIAPDPDKIIASVINK